MKKQTNQPLIRNRRWMFVRAVIALLAVAGIAYMLRASGATVSFVSLELESGSLSGNTAIASDSTASNGGAVKFGAGNTGGLRVSDNGRFIVKGDGTPFFYLADTAWSMLVSLNQADMTEYMTTRRNQGYTVVQTSIYFNQNGQPQGSPISGSVSTINQAFFQNQVDFAVNKAEELGLVLALHPIWADGQTNNGTISSTNAQGYGQFLGNRYKNETNIIWVMGGDYPGAGQESIWRNLARGIAIGQTGSEDYSKSLMTYHPRGDETSSTWFHSDAWLDFNSVQSGHCPSNPLPYDLVGADYGRTPTKPVIDFEPMYENHPYCWANPPDGHSNALDARKMAYWDVFSGGFGHAYGHHSVWPFVTNANSHPFNSWGGGATGTWRDGLNADGGKQMVHIRKLMESRPFLSRIPDQTIITSSTGGAMDRKVATRSSDGSYLLVYTVGSVSVNLNKLSGTSVNAYWYNPRTGAATDVSVAKGASVQVNPPDGNDWVFVADDASRSFGRPGQ